MNWYINVMKNYGKFDGRARRKEYWMFSLINFVLFIPYALLSGIFLSNTIGSILYILGLIIVFGIPSLSVTARRLHDINFSGFWILINFVPLLGPIALFILTVLEGTSGDNKFGPNPKAIQELI